MIRQTLFWIILITSIFSNPETHCSRHVKNSNRLNDEDKSNTKVNEYEMASYRRSKRHDHSDYDNDYERGYPTDNHNDDDYDYEQNDDIYMENSDHHEERHKKMSHRSRHDDNDDDSDDHYSRISVGNRHNDKHSSKRHEKDRYDKSRGRKYRSRKHDDYDRHDRYGSHMRSHHDDYDSRHYDDMHHSQYGGHHFDECNRDCCDDKCRDYCDPCKCKIQYYRNKYCEDFENVKGKYDKYECGENLFCTKVNKNACCTNNNCGTSCSNDCNTCCDNHVYNNNCNPCCDTNVYSHNICGDSTCCNNNNSCEQDCIDKKEICVCEADESYGDGSYMRSHGHSNSYGHRRGHDGYKMGSKRHYGSRHRSHRNSKDHYGMYGHHFKHNCKFNATKCEFAPCEMRSTFFQQTACNDHNVYNCLEDAAKACCKCDDCRGITFLASEGKFTIRGGNPQRGVNTDQRSIMRIFDDNKC